MSVVINPAIPDARQVQNLGWLLRNWKLVESFTFAETTDSGFWDLILVASLKDGRSYLTHYADLGVCLDFLHRPIFYGLTVYNRLPNRPGVYNLGDRFTLRKAS